MKEILLRLAMVLIIVVAVIIAQPWKSVDFASGTIVLLGIAAVVMFLTNK